MLPKSLSSGLLLPEQRELYLPARFGGIFAQTLLIRKYSRMVKALLAFIRRNIKMSCCSADLPFWSKL